MNTSNGIKKVFFILAVAAFIAIVSLIYFMKTAIAPTISDVNTKALEYYNSLLKSKNLTFQEEPVKILKKSNPDNKWKYLKGFDINNVIKDKKIRIEIYDSATLDDLYKASQGTTPSVVEIKDIDGYNAFLSDGKETYRIGNLGLTDISTINISEKDVNYDGANEIILYSGLIHSRTIIIGFNRDAQRWEEWLQTGIIDYIDFENNGVKTITTTATGSIAPLANIHIWNKNHFNTICVSQMLGYNRMAILKKDNKVYFYPDMIPSNEKRKVYALKNGAIKEVEGVNLYENKQ